jgi:hypothetical protein
MKIEVMTYFEQKDGMCGVGFDMIDNFDLFNIKIDIFEIWKQAN